MSELFTFHKITANGLRFHYAESGPSHGPPVILLHGFPEFWYSWRYQLSALAQVGFRVIAPDLRGYNLTDKPEGASAYEIETLCDDVGALVRALGYNRVDLIGHDWGGVVAWATASAPEHQKAVKRLIICNAPHPLTYLNRLSLKQLRMSWYFFFFQLPYFPERWLSNNNFEKLGAILRASSVKGTFTDEDLAKYKEALAQPGALTAAINYYRSMLRGNPYRIKNWLVPVRAKTLLIWGEQDPALSKDLTKNLDEWVNDLQVAYLPEAGHWVQQEQPEAVNRLMINFLDTDHISHSGIHPVK